MRYTQRMNWQPIETAPRDGSAFLAFEDGKMAVGSLHAWASGESFYIEHVSGYEYEFEMDKPTHWAPLPEPPTASD